MHWRSRRRAPRGPTPSPSTCAVRLAPPHATAAALSVQGPQSPALANNEQPFLNPPATDVGNNSQFWSSFNIAPKRVQACGWARQINTGMFPISKDMTRVDRSH
jgi:oxalate decarboxylase